MSQPQILLQSIHDTVIVTFVSTCNSPIKMTTKKLKKDKTIIMIPQVIKDYNSHIRGVDLHDQFITYYTCCRKTRRWWLYLFWHLFDIAIVNALILKNHHYNDCIQTQLEFRRQLAKEMIGTFRNRKISTTMIKNTYPQMHFVGKTNESHNCVICGAPKNRTRTIYFCKQCKCIFMCTSLF